MIAAEMIRAAESIELRKQMYGDAPGEAGGEKDAK